MKYLFNDCITMSCHCWANVRIQYNCGPTLQSLWANLGYQLTNLRPSLQSWAKVVPMPLWCLGLTLFAGHRAKSSKNAVFFAFFANFVQSVSKNVKKHCFLTLFAGHRAKSSKNAVFFAFFANFVQCVSKNVKKHCFLTLFAGHRAKSSKNALFRIFCELCTKCLEKREKTLFSYTFCRTSCKKLKNRCFSHFLRTLYKVSRKT